MFNVKSCHMPHLGQHVDSKIAYGLFKNIRICIQPLKTRALHVPCDKLARLFATIPCPAHRASLQIFQ